MKVFILKNSFSFILIGIILLFSLMLVYNPPGEESARYIEVEVKKGETLWKIAKEYVDEDMNTAELVASIEEVNQMNGRMLQSGERIMIPLEKEAAVQYTMNKE